jgi:Bacterial cell division membrane protein
MNIISKTFKGDKATWSIALLLGVISLLAVYSATGTIAYTKYDGNTGQVLMKHAITLFLGFCAMFTAYKINYRHYSKIFQIGLWLCVPLLIYTLIFGANLNDASRSIRILGISFQSSDLAKIALITYLSRELALKQDEIKDFRKSVVPIIIPTFIIVGLILPENLSTAVMLLAACVVLMFVGRVKFTHLLIIGGIAVACLAIYILIMMQRPEGQRGRVGTWMKRIETSSEGKKAEESAFDPFDKDHFQQTHSKIAIATGGVTGKGPGKSTQRNFLPHPYSDFIYAIILEEYGFAGGFFTLLLYLILLTRSVKIMHKRPLSFGGLMSFGLMFLLVMQAMINMGVAVGALPVTGQPLPFVSMGGTSIIFTGISIGMMLSVTKDIEREENARKEAESLTNNEGFEAKEEIEKTDIDE